MARAIGAALAAAVVLALTGCSGASTPTRTVTVTVTAGAPAASAAPAGSAAASVVSACALLPKAEAERIVGATLLAGEEGNPADPSCVYNTSPTGPKTAQVMVVAGPGAKKTYDIDRGLRHPFTDVAGVGDEAHREEFAIYFRKGTTWAGISVVTLDDASALPALLGSAASAVVARLP
jgi:hypothetical protein